LCVGLCIAASTLFVPSVAAAFAAGVLFGLGGGTLLSLLGNSLGSVGASLIGRYVTREWTARALADSLRQKLLGGVGHRLDSFNRGVCLSWRVEPGCRSPWRSNTRPDSARMVARVCGADGDRPLDRISETPDATRMARRLTMPAHWRPRCRPDQGVIDDLFRSNSNSTRFRLRPQR
jgi:hypothetical protein